jgi:DNA-binding MarR family transcriptional regulator
MDRVDAIVGQWAVELPDLDTAAMATWGRIYRLAAAMGAAMEELYQQHGISRGDFDVLATLRRSGPPYRLTPTRLAAASMLTTGGMTGRLRRLEAAGLIDRRGDSRDRRSSSVGLTPAARRLIEQATRDGVALQERALAGLPADTREGLDGTLRALMANDVLLPHQPN